MGAGEYVGLPFQYGFNRQGFVKAYDFETKSYTLEYEGISVVNDEAEVVVHEDEVDDYFSIEEWAEAEDFACVNPRGKIAYSRFGYIITPEGTVYSLTDYAVHGILCALIHPDIAKECGFRQPDKNPGSSHYQAFELDNYKKIPSIRISSGHITGTLYVSTWRKPVTEAQIASLLEVGKVMGTNARTKIATNFAGDMTFTKLITRLREGVGDDE